MIKPHKTSGTAALLGGMERKSGGHEDQRTKDMHRLQGDSKHSLLITEARYK